MGAGLLTSRTNPSFEIKDLLHLEILYNQVEPKIRKKDPPEKSGGLGDCEKLETSKNGENRKEKKKKGHRTPRGPFVEKKKNLSARNYLERKTARDPERGRHFTGGEREATYWGGHS